MIGREETGEEKNRKGRRIEQNDWKIDQDIIIYNTI